jgi:O-antigen/teichoic acid export membrane protein
VGLQLLKTEFEQIEPTDEFTGAVLAEEAKTEGWETSSIAGDIVTLGAGTVLAAAFNTMLIFLIPRLMSVEEYGYWRLFLLYAGYVGFLHFGFADGALLRWAGRTLEAIHHEVGPSWKYMILQHLAVTLPVCAVLGILPRLSMHFRLVCAGVLVFGLIMNSATLLQYSLQAGRVFRPVAIAAAVPPGVFVVLAFCWSLKNTPTANELMALYAIAWLVVLIYLWVRVKPQFANSPDAAWTLGKTLTAIGWPVVLANTGYGLVQSADRLVVSSALPITQFAQYSLAASAMFVPLTAIAAVARVFFAHAAAVEHDDRANIYKHMSRFLLIAWSLLLPYFFVLEAFVKRFLPKYIPSLPVAGILMISVIFLAGIQILHMNYFYLYGKQREFLYRTIAALALSVVVALVLTGWLHSLLAVAVGQVAALAFWWMVNEWGLRRTTGQSRKDWSRIFAVVGWSMTSYGFVLWCTPHAGWRIPIYYGLVVGALWLSCAEEFRLGWRLLHESAAGLSQQPALDSR